MFIVIANSSNNNNKKTQKQGLRGSTITKIKKFESPFLRVVSLQIPEKMHLVIANSSSLKKKKTLETGYERKDQYKNQRT